MYEMEGPYPASPRQAGQLAGLAGAARRPPGPGTRASRPVSRLLPRSRGQPQVVPVSNGESIITAYANAAQGPAASHFLFSAIHEGIHRKQAVIRISRRLSTGLFTAYPQATGCKPQNTRAAVAACNRLIVSQRLPGNRRCPESMRAQMADHPASRSAGSE